MDNGNNGDFMVVYNGTGQAGTLYSNLLLTVGRLYRFKASALNFNGEGTVSAET
jgi:hypothetical protein